MPERVKVPCGTCRGTGKVAYGPWGVRPPRTSCPDCDGEGTAVRRPKHEPGGAFHIVDDRGWITSSTNDMAAAVAFAGAAGLYVRRASQ